MCDFSSARVSQIRCKMLSSQGQSIRADHKKSAPRQSFSATLPIPSSDSVFLPPFFLSRIFCSFYPPPQSASAVKPRSLCIALWLAALGGGVHNRLCHASLWLTASVCLTLFFYTTNLQPLCPPPHSPNLLFFYGPFLPPSLFLLSTLSAPHRQFTSGRITCFSLPCFFFPTSSSDRKERNYKWDLF